jgi:hypothetical protein
MAARSSRHAIGASVGPDLLTTIRAEIDARLSELAPVLAEYEELLSVIDALAPDRGGVADAVRSPAAPGRSRRGVAAGSGARARPVAAGARAKKAARPKTDTARPTTARRARRRERAAHSPAGQAILAALEHGSHTLAELTVVTALPASDIRDSLRRLRRRSAIVKADRDGKAAYALPDSPVVGG